MGQVGSGAGSFAMNVGPASSLAYHGALGGLVDEVNRIMAARPDLAELVGLGNLDLMFDNHHNHAAFMDNVFFLGNLDLLERTVPWVYRVYGARGFSMDYFPVELEAWKQAVGRQLPEALARPVLETYAWMLQGHERFQEASCRLAAEAAEAPVQFQRLIPQFLEGNLRRVEQEVAVILGPAPTLEALYLQVLDPVMREVGRLWEASRISSAQEHVASALVTRLMSMAYTRQDLEPQDGKTAVVCAGPGEQHQIGAWMVSDLLELRGWDAKLLGADASMEGLVSMVSSVRPFLLAVSVTMPFHLRQVSAAIQAIRQRHPQDGPRILLGGQAIHQDPSMALALGADGFAADARGAALLADQWWEAVHP